MSAVSACWVPSSLLSFVAIRHAGIALRYAVLWLYAIFIISHCVTAGCCGDYLFIGMILLYAVKQYGLDQQSLSPFYGALHTCKKRYLMMS